MRRWLASSCALALLVSSASWAWLHRDELGVVRSRPVHWKALPPTSSGRQPVVIFSEGSGLGPSWNVRIFDDGSVIDDREGRDPQRLEGTLGREAALALARRVEDRIGRPELRRELRSQDGPISSISSRVGETWTTDRAYGMFHAGVETRFYFRRFGFDPHPSSRFFDTITELTTLPLRDVHMWVPASTDLCLQRADYATTSEPWPEALPKPPPLEELSAKSPPCWRVTGDYERAVRDRVKSPTDWAVSFAGHKWQLWTQVHVPGEAALVGAPSPSP